MKKIFALYLYCFVCLNVNAQTVGHVLPKSFTQSGDISSVIPQIVLPEFNLIEAKRLDNHDAAIGDLPKFSRSIFTNVTLDNSGVWAELPNGDRLWRVQITSRGALALLPYYNKFYLPYGATFHVYSNGKDEINGAFTAMNNPADGYYAIGLIHGESVIMEYYEPREVRGKGVISLNEVGHAYRWVNDYFPKRSKTQNDTLGFNMSDGCEINVNCSEGADWQDQKRSVVCMIVKSSFGQGICSGTLVNNARQDCTPYILSAQHCSLGTNANHFSQWLFYFNYESPNCNTPLTIGPLGDYFIGGCTKIADSNDNGGDSGSDFLLLRLSNVPPDTFNIYYSGWSNADVPAVSGVTIHHPEGDVKKISTYTQPLVNTSWGLSVDSTHWIVQWATTTNGHGVTEVGSSGSPLYNQQKQVVGTLTGGDSYCNFPNAPDQYGKFSFGWNRNGTGNNEQLKPWLDPDNTGIVSINGKNADCTTGIGPISSETHLFMAFPNPSSTGVFQLQFDKYENRNVSVFDLLGRNVLSLKSKEVILDINLSAQNKGVYILCVEGSNGKMVKKLIAD